MRGVLLSTMLCVLASVAAAEPRAADDPRIALAVVGLDAHRANVETAIANATRDLVGELRGGTSSMGGRGRVVLVDGKLTAEWIHVELRAAGNSAVQYVARVRRPAGTLTRGSVVSVSELPRRVVADVLQGLMTATGAARRAPYVAIVTERDADDLARPLQEALQRRGWQIAPPREVALAATTLASSVRGAARWHQMRQMLSADAVLVVDRTNKSRARALIEVTTFDPGLERGVARTAPSARVRDATASLAALVSVRTGHVR